MAEGGLSQADFARVMGVDRAQVTRWAASGLPMLEKHTVAAARGAEWVRENVGTHRLRDTLGARQMKRAELAVWVRNLRFAYTGSDENAAYIAAELLLPHLPEPVTRALVARLLRRCREGSAECLADDVAPPKGCGSWLDTPEFQREFPDDIDWVELLERHAAGELEKVGADA